MKKLMSLLFITISIFADNQKNENKAVTPSPDSKIITCGTWKQMISVQWQLLQNKDDYWVTSRADLKKINAFIDLDTQKRWHYAKADVKKTSEGKVYEIILLDNLDKLDLLEGSLKNKNGEVKGQVEQSDECKAIAAMYHELEKLNATQEKVK